jgi:hypothetical protein
MNFIRIAVAIALAFPAPGQTGDTSKWEKRRALHPELMSTFDLAESAPRGLKALALLHIASAPALNDQEWKQHLLQEGFEAAAQFFVPSPARSVALPQNATLTSLPRRIQNSAVMNSGLDRLSLQTSAIREMSRLGMPQARRMFEQISPLHVTRLTCSSVLVPDVDAYFKTAELLANSEFLSSGRKQRFEFLHSVIEGISPPVEISPAAELIEKQSVSARDKYVLAVQFARSFETISRDSRSFLETLDADATHVLQLVDSLDLGTALLVLKAWRTYLVTNWNGPSCGEITDPNWPYQASLKRAVDASIVASIPAKIQRRILNLQVSLLNWIRHFRRRSRRNLTFEPRQKWFALEFGGGRIGLSDADKNNAEWQSRFGEYLAAIDKLQQAPGESDLDLIRKKWDLMGAAILIAPAGPLRDATVERYVSLLKISSRSEEMLPYWYYEVHALIDLSEKFNNGRSAILKLLKGSHDPLLELVARLSSS